jgi:hypothetical protein
VTTHHDGRYFMPPLPEWEYATWEGAEYARMRDAAAKTFEERLEAVAEMARLAEEFRVAREAASGDEVSATPPEDPPSAEPPPQVLPRE